MKPITIETAPDIPQVRRFISNQHENHRQDLKQIARIAMWKSKDTWKPELGMSLENYILVAVRRASLTMRRDEGRATEKLVPLDDCYNLTASSHEDAILDKITIRKLISKLEPETRELVELIMMGFNSHEAVALMNPALSFNELRYRGKVLRETIRRLRKKI